MAQNREFKGIWIPAEIWLDGDLQPADKMIIAEIDSLCNEETGCFASNEYLASFCQCSVRRVSQSISLLTTKGYIVETSFDGRQRVIFTKYAKQSSKKCYADTQNMQENNNSLDTNISKENILKESECSAENKVGCTFIADNAKPSNDGKAKKEKPNLVTEEEINTYFEKTYKLYPRHESKVQGHKTYLKKLKKLDSEIARKKALYIYKCLENQIKVWERENREKQFIPLISSWLNANFED